MVNSPQQQTNNAAIEQLHRMQLNSERPRQGKGFIFVNEI